MAQKQVSALLASAAVMAACVGSLHLVGNQANAKGSSSDISFGNRSLIEDEVGEANQAFYEAKEKGTEAMADKDYEEAEEAFEEALANYKNAPETLIYKNNAAIGDNDAYTIAVAVPIDEEKENGANDAKEMLRGIAQSQTEVNASGGVNGTPIRVVIADDNSDTEVAKSVAQSFVDDKDILGVVGHYNSDTSIAASDIYQDEGLVMISPTSTSVVLSNKGDYIFRSLTTDGFNTAELSRYMMRSLSLNNAAIFYNSESEYSKGLRELFKKELGYEGGKVVTEFNLSDAGFEPESAIAEAQSEGAEAIILFHNSGVIETALDVIRANEGQLPILSGDSGYKPQMYEISDYTAGVLVATVPWNLLGGNENSPYSKAARNLWGGDVSWRTAMTYDATQALVAALSESDDREGIKDALLSPSFSAQGVEEPIRFQETTGDRDGSPKLVTVGANPQVPGKFGFVLVERE